MQMQLGKNFNKLLHNKYVLYIVLFLAITNILGYLTIGDWNSLVLFIVLGVLSTHFSKNMIINLSIAMIGTNFIFAGNRIREGFKENAASRENNKKQHNKPHHKQPVLHNRNEKEEKKESANQLATEKNGVAATDATSKKIDNTCPWTTKIECDASGMTWTPDAEGCKCSGTKQGMATLNPAPVDGVEIEVEEEDLGPNVDRVDYASTLESAYDNLQKMLGEGGMKNLSGETAKLVNQQKELAGQLESMAPLLKQAEGLLNNLDMPDLKQFEGVFEKLGLSKKK